MVFKVEERLHKNCPECERASYMAGYVALHMEWPQATYEVVRCGKKGLRTVEHSARVSVAE
jgi:hypothetical protein